MGLNQVEYSLLEPLLGSDGEDRADIEFKPVTRSAQAANRAESCGRTRLFILSIFAFLIIYLTIATSHVDLPQIVVRVPPDENPDNSHFMLSPDPESTTTTTIAQVHANFVFNHTVSTTSSPPITTASSPHLTNASLIQVPKGYLVWSPKCKIASLDPMASDVMRLYHREKALSCSSKAALTSVDWNPETRKYYLKVSDSARSHYHLSVADRCTYQELTRKSENQIRLSDGVKFSSQLELSGDTEFVYVECFNSGQKKLVYRDVHFVAQRKTAILNRLKALPKKEPSSTDNNTTERQIPSVLMIGIDSISRLNLLRAMPNTAQHLYDQGWFEMKGYNKMGDNTFPNLMAILTGYNDTYAYDKCKPHLESGLDECDLIWKKFADAGYVTGYAEDEPEIGTFNYRKKGFKVTPTDFYGRAGMIAANRLPKVMRSSLAICLGYRSSADYIYKYGLDITETFQEEGTFGLYWTNSFSHNDLNTPSSMDDRVRFYLQDLKKRGILRDSIVVFFSDHGIRFGPVRKLVTGWMEERLPFLFFWLPEWFREKYPEIVEALRVNRNRLTNPYDLHLTLKHILRLSGRASAADVAAKDIALGCEKCQSMFNEVPWDRSCDDVSIAPHWCTCAPYLPIDKGSKIVKRAAKFLLEYINRDIKRMLNGTTKENGGRLCAELHLHSIYFAGETEYKSDNNDILIQFETSPGGGEFESTVRYVKANDHFSVTGTISRLNTYSKHSNCVSDEHLRKYCECS